MSDKSFCSLDDCWSLYECAHSAELEPVMVELREWLAAQTNSVAVALTRNPETDWSKRDMRSIERDLIATFRPKRHAHRFLISLHYVVQCWMAFTGRTCPLPRVAFLRGKAPNPLSPKSVEAKRQHAQLRELLLSFVARLQEGTADGIDVLALAIISGCVGFHFLHRAFVCTVTEALADPTKLFLQIAGRVALSVSLPVHGVSNAEHRILFPDPLTSALLMRVDRNEVLALVKSCSPAGLTAEEQTHRLLSLLAARVAQVLAILAPATGARITSLQELLRVCARASYFYLPFGAVAYLTRKSRSHSLRLSVLARIDKSVRLLTVPQEQRAESARSSNNRASLSGASETELAGPSVPEASKLPDLQTWLQELRTALAGSSINAVRRRLGDFLKRKDLPLSAIRIGEWAQFELAKKRRNTAGLSTLRSYVILLAKFLGPRLGADDPVTLGVTGLDDVYLESICDHADSSSGASQSSQLRYYRCVVLFHLFLCRTHEAKPLEELSGLGGGCLPVDANMFSAAEFQQLLAAVRIARVIPPSQHIVVCLLIILGYRCGLRRSEAYHLRACDVDRGPDIMLLLLDIPDRGLKTLNSRRRLNLSALLRPEELALFLDHLAKRREFVGDRGDLFKTAADESWLSEDNLFDEIHRLMRTTLHCKGLRYHLGRHSLCSNLVELLLSRPSKETSENVINFRKRLFASNKIIGVDLDAIASILGHGDPKQVSLQHYCHTMFRVVDSYLASDPRLTIPKRTMVVASGLPETTAYRIASEGPNAIPSYLFATRFREELRQYERSTRRSNAVDLPSPAKNHLSRALLCARALVDPTLSLEGISDSTGLSLPQVQRLNGILAQSLTNAGSDEGSASTDPSQLTTRNREIFCSVALKLSASLDDHKPQFDQLLSNFADTYWSSLECCLFRGATAMTKAKRFLRLLREAEVTDDHIRVVLFSEENENRAQKLRAQLGIPNAVVAFRRPPNNKSDASLTWVGIQPLFDQLGKHGAVPKASSAFWAVLKFANSALQRVDEIFPECRNDGVAQ